MTSDYFIVPASPDYFSVMAIDSLATVFPRWRAWSKQAASMSVFQEAAYPFPSTIPKFLGTIIQKYRIRDRSTAAIAGEGAPTSGTPAAGFQKWINQINAKVVSGLVPALKTQEMLLSDKKYKHAKIEKDYCLASISDFNSLIAKAQEHQVPVFSLTDEQIGLGGVILDRTNTSKDMFVRIFTQLAKLVVELTTK